MYEAEFKRLNYRLANAFMLYGSCRLSVWLQLEIIKEKLSYDERLILRDSDYKLDIAKDFLSSGSLFATKKLLIIELEKGIPIRELKELLKCVNDDSRLVLAFYEARALKDLELSLNNNFVRFFDKKTSSEQINLLKEFADFYKISASFEALEYLQKNYEFDIFKAGCEMLKYKNAKLDLATLKEHCEPDNALSFDDFLSNYLSCKDPREYIYKICENEDEIAILNKFYASLARLFTISAHLKQNGRIDYKVAFGYTPPRQVCAEYEAQARKLADFYEEIFALLLECEYQLKHEGSGKEELISSLLKLYFLINS